MNKLNALRIVNPVLALIFFSQALTGLAHETIPYEWFKFVHRGGGLLLLAAVSAHVYLNWSWIRATFIKRGQDVSKS